MKSVRVVTIRPAREVMVEIMPEDSASMVVSKSGLDVNDYRLVNPQTQGRFEATEMVYPTVEDGGKLHAVPESSVGNGGKS